MFTYWFLTLEEAFLKLFCKSKICVSLKKFKNMLIKKKKEYAHYSLFKIKRFYGK